MRRLVSSLLLLTAVILQGCAPSPSPQPRSDPDSEVLLTLPYSWTRRLPLPLGEDLNDVTFNGERFVAVGDEEIWTSDDGLSWRKVEADLKLVLLREVAYGNGLFVAVGHSLRDDEMTVAYTSSDAETWERHVVAKDNLLDAVAFGEDRFVAAGSDGLIMSSPDGKQWTPSHCGSTILNGVAYGNGVFVAGGARRTICLSDDGLTWERVQSAPGETIVTVAYGNGRFVAAGSLSPGGVLTSEDGHAWRREQGPADLWVDRAAFLDGAFWLLGEHRMARISGERWEEVAIPDRALGVRLNVIASGRGRVVAVGGGGLIMTTADGDRWERPRDGFNGELQAVAHGAGRFVIVGDGNARRNVSPGIALVSTDGEAWERYPTGPPARAVTYGQDRFVAVGAGGRVIHSADGQDWTSAASGTTGALYGVTWTGERYLAVGDEGTIIHSADGRDWTALKPVTRGLLKGVAYGGGTYVAVGLYGNILTSKDALTWQSQQTKYSFQAVAYGNGQFVAVGQSAPMLGIPGVILTSVDGETWDAQLESMRESYMSVVWAENRWVVGAGGETARYYLSADGKTWQAGALPTPVDLVGLAYADGRIVGVQRGNATLTLDLP